MSEERNLKMTGATSFHFPFDGGAFDLELIAFGTPLNVRLIDKAISLLTLARETVESEPSTPPEKGE